MATGDSKLSVALARLVKGGGARWFSGESLDVNPWRPFAGAHTLSHREALIRLLKFISGRSDMGNNWISSPEQLSWCRQQSARYGNATSIVCGRAPGPGIGSLVHPRI